MINTLLRFLKYNDHVYLNAVYRTTVVSPQFHRHILNRILFLFKLFTSFVLSLKSCSTASTPSTPQPSPSATIILRHRTLQYFTEYIRSTTYSSKMQRFPSKMENGETTHHFTDYFAKKEYIFNIYHLNCSR